MIPSSSTDVWHIKDEYTIEEVKRKMEAPLNTSLEVYIGALPAKVSLPTLAYGPSGIHFLPATQDYSEHDLEDRTH